MICGAEIKATAGNDTVGRGIYTLNLTSPKPVWTHVPGGESLVSDVSIRHTSLAICGDRLFVLCGVGISTSDDASEDASGVGVGSFYIFDIKTRVWYAGPIIPALVSAISFLFLLV